MPGWDEAAVSGMSVVEGVSLDDWPPDGVALVVF